MEFYKFGIARSRNGFLFYKIIRYLQTYSFKVKHETIISNI